MCSVLRVLLFFSLFLLLLLFVRLRCALVGTVTTFIFRVLVCKLIVINKVWGRLVEARLSAILPRYSAGWMLKEDAQASKNHSEHASVKDFWIRGCIEICGRQARGEIEFIGPGTEELWNRTCSNPPFRIVT